MKIHHINHSLSDIDRATLCFKGDLIIYQNVSAMQALIDFADRRLRESLNGLDPTTAQAELDPQAFLQKVGEVQKKFRNSDEAKRLFFKVQEECGVNLDKTYYDHFPMRIVPYGKAYQGARCSEITHHRDTWGGNIYSQINWWAPLYEVTEQRTIALYPDYWRTPVKNNTADWCFKTFITLRKEAEEKMQGGAEMRISYPSSPTPSQDFDESNVLKVSLNPGDVLNFSSANLHASVPNSSNKTRYSVEMRTINLDDLQVGRKAINIDNEGKLPMYQWFRNINTKVGLDKAM